MYIKERYESLDIESLTKEIDRISQLIKKYEERIEDTMSPLYEREKARLALNNERHLLAYATYFKTKLTLLTK